MNKFKVWIGGGILRYRVKGNEVQMKGGGTGPFWGFAHFTPFESEEKATAAAKRWAEKEGGVFIPSVKKNQE